MHNFKNVSKESFDNVAVYKNVTAKDFKEVNIFDVYELVRTSFKEATTQILERFSIAIANRFVDYPKAPYQEAKQASLQTVVFSGCFSRAQGFSKIAKHSGRICLDIDNNTKEELTDFLHSINTGKYPNIEAAALSVSGAVNGSLWVNVKVEIPNSLAGIDKDLINKLGLSKDNFKEVLHSAFYEMFANLLEKESSIIAGKTSNITHPRYLTNDPNIYVNPQAKRLRLTHLLKYLQETKPEKSSFSGVNFTDVIDNDIFKTADNFARAKGFEFCEGQKHSYINRFAICLNLLGVDKTLAKEYFDSKGIDIRSNCIDHPYRRYKDSFGLWKVEPIFKADLTIEADFYSDKERKTRTRLTDIVRANEMPLEAIFGAIWNVPTGTGKTTAIIELAKQNKIVFFAPLSGLVAQVYSDAKAKGIDTEIYTGESANRKHLKERLTSFDFNTGSYINFPQMIVCTFASAASLLKMIGESNCKQYNCIIDEFHTTATAAKAGFMLKSINQLLDLVPNFKSITGLTGTPFLNLHPNTANLKKVAVKLKGTPKTKAIIIEAKNDLQAAANQFKKAVAQDRQAMILLNDKGDRLTDLQALVSGAIPLNNLSIINSDTKGEKAFLELIEKGQFPTDTKAIITTTVLEMGLNENGETPTDIIILGTFHPITIKQFKERKRLADCVLYIIRDNRSPKNSPSIDKEKEAAKMIETATAICTILNNEPASLYTRSIRSDLQRMYIKETSKGFEPDYCAIQNAVFEAEKIYLNSYIDKLTIELQNFDFEVLQGMDSSEPEPDFKIQALERKETKKEAEQLLFNEIVEKLQASSKPEDLATDATNDKSTKKEAKQFYSMFLDIQKYCKTGEQALKLFIATDGKKAKAKQTVSRLIYKLEKPKNEGLGKAAFALMNGFKIGEKLTADQLRAKVIECLQKDPTINIEPFAKAKRIDASLKRLRIFFEVKKSKKEDVYKIRELPKDIN